MIELILISLLLWVLLIIVGAAFGGQKQGFSSVHNPGNRHCVFSPKYKSVAPHLANELWEWQVEQLLSSPSNWKSNHLESFPAIKSLNVLESFGELTKK